MPARNAGSLDGTNAEVAAASAAAVICSPFSGPTGSPFDLDSAGNFSTGALNTGIGFGIGKLNVIGPTAPASIKAAGFTDSYVPGVTMPDNTAATLAILTAIGGGKSDVYGVSAPYDVQPLLAFGGGCERDAGAGPAFTGFAMKMVTAPGAVAIDAAVEAGFTNESSRALVTGESVFGSEVAASPAVT